MMICDGLLRADHWRRGWVCLVLAVMSGVVMTAVAPARAADDASDFFEVLPARLDGLDPHAVFPRGQKFPFAVYSQGSVKAKAFGSTMAGHMYHFRPENLVEAQRQDLQVIGRITSGWSKNDLAKVTEQEIRQAIAGRVREILAWPGQERIAWWYLTPEELRYWRKHEINYLRIATETIRQTDPLKRPIWMYDPGHRDSASLARTAAWLDIVGKGLYTNYSGQMNDRVWVRWSLQQQKHAMAGSSHAAVSIAVPEMFQHPGKYDPALLEDESRAVERIKTWVRHDVYAALVEGAQGVVIYAAVRRLRSTPPFTGDIFNAYNDAYSQVAKELTGELDLGRAFLFGQRRGDLQVQVIDGPPTVSLTFLKYPSQTFSSVAHADLAWNGRRYLVLVNSAPQPVRVKLSGFPAGQSDFHSLIDEAHHTAASLKEAALELALNPWQVCVYRVDRASASASR